MPHFETEMSATHRVQFAPLSETQEKDPDHRLIAPKKVLVSIGQTAIEITQILTPMGSQLALKRRVDADLAHLFAITPQQKQETYHDFDDAEHHILPLEPNDQVDFGRSLGVWLTSKVPSVDRYNEFLHSPLSHAIRHDPRIASYHLHLEVITEDNGPHKIMLQTVDKEYETRLALDF